MAEIEIPKRITPSGGPIVRFAAASNSSNMPIGSVGSLDGSGDAVPVAVDATAVFAVIDRQLDDNGDVIIRADIGGAIVHDVVFPGATAAGTSVEWVDNQTAQAPTDEGDQGGRVIKVVSTNVADVILPPFGRATPTAVV